MVTAGQVQASSPRMGKVESMRPADWKRLTAAIHDVLLKEWDPIGVRDEPMAQDEYDAYVPRIYGLLKRGASRTAIAEYLVELETETMGLGGNRRRMFRHSLQAADALLALLQQGVAEEGWGDA